MLVLGKAFHLSIESLPSCCLQDPLTRGCFGKVGDCKNAGRKSSGDELSSLSGVSAVFFGGSLGRIFGMLNITSPIATIAQTVCGIIWKKVQILWHNLLNASSG